MKLKNVMIYIFIFLSFGVLLLSYGCENISSGISKTDAENIYNEISNEIPEYLYLGEKLELPDKYNGENITYTFDQTDYFNENMVVIKEGLSSHIVINIDILIGKHHFTHKIKIHQNMEKYFEKVLSYISGKFPSGVYAKDASLYYSYPGDKEISISYKSLNPEYVTDEGKRISHDFDEDVVLQCTLSKNGVTHVEDIRFISMGISYEERMEIALEYIDDFFKNTEFVEGVELPTNHPLYGGRFRWIAEDPTIIYDYKTIHLPKETKTTHIIGEIMFGSTEREILVYEVDLQKRPDYITDEVYVKTFLETVLSSVDDYLTLYDGSKADINTEYLIDENIKAVNNSYYTDIVRPTVPQEKLDKLLYEGYTMPNDENVLWIVVHETGMSYAGDDALLLAKYQYNIAYGEEGREASWGYTVDEHSIYQSFPDTYRLWHATDGKTIGGGNTNGIGIEMCVNRDGIYNVSMLNNARLMAGLLYKYGLGMMNMKQHSDFYIYKSCPEIMRADRRWYEYLTLIEREYISQTILSNFKIEYSIDMPKMAIDGVYDFTSLESGQSVDIIVSINGDEFIITTTKK
ncbi:MAG: N-acetylmuramoyl-L-alanine amidase [Bacilli bacterium]|nr:N-acetylmuramoyl-L-alanine amidase [Bacilli bacterium]